MERDDAMGGGYGAGAAVAGVGASDPRWFLGKAPDLQAKQRLFCFAFAGGSAAMYAPWIRALAPAIDVCPIELPGRWSRTREPAYDCMQRLQADLVAALRPYAARPFSMFGYSLGGLVAYEAAQGLRRACGREPEQLIVAARTAPRTFDGTRVTDLPDAAFLARIERLYGAMPEAIRREPELRDMAIRITRADLKVVESYEYRPEAALNCPITAFAGTQDQNTPAADLEAWARRTSARFSLRWFEGGHFFINSCGPRVLDAVRSALVTA